MPDHPTEAGALPATRALVALLGLWGALAGIRWLAALPITEPRIFRDELLHWQLAQAFAHREPFTLFGESLRDYPAVLYPAILSLVFHVADGVRAFDLARGLNAMLVGAVVFPTYGLAHELGTRRSALGAAVLAGLVPGGIYSALIMEESVYYPLFVLSCWLSFRVLVRGGTANAVLCAVALCLTYFTKPLVLPLIVAYALGVAAWGGIELRRRSWSPQLARGLTVRLLPLLIFGTAVVVRAMLTPGHPGIGSPSELLLSRFYTEESQGPLLPRLKPLLKVLFALVAALALGTGVAPVAALLGVRRSGAGGGTRTAYAAFVALVVVIYLVAIARHTLNLNDLPRPHERYLFPVAPLLFALFLTGSAPSVRGWALALVLAAIVVTVGPLGPLMLTNVRTIDAPSLTAPWLLRRALPGGPWAALAIGSAALGVGWGAIRLRRRPWLSAAWLGAGLLILNGYWYRDLYRQTYLNPTSHLVHGLAERLGPSGRVTVVVQDRNPALMLIALYSKFWLGARASAYWAGDGPEPWYTEGSMPTGRPALQGDPAYLVVRRPAETPCPGARRVRGLAPEAGLPVVVLEVPAGGCGDLGETGLAPGAAALPPPRPERRVS